MSRRRTQPIFAAVVVDVRAMTSAPVTSTAGLQEKAGLQEDDSFADRSGRSYALVDDRLTAADVTDRASKGALIVWDSCGCGGYCELSWLEPADIVQLVATGAPKVPRKYRYLCEFSEWRAADGSTLVLVQGPVEWGFRMGDDR